MQLDLKQVHQVKLLFTPQHETDGGRVKGDSLDRFPSDLSHDGALSSQILVTQTQEVVDDEGCAQSHTEEEEKCFKVIIEGQVYVFWLLFLRLLGNRIPLVIVIPPGHRGVRTKMATFVEQAGVATHLRSSLGPCRSTRSTPRW